MGNALENGKITGAWGIATAVILLVVLAISVLTKDGFEIGTNPIGDLFSEDIFVYGLILVGVLGVVFGALVALSSPGPKTFIGKVRGVLISISGILLIVLSYTEKEGSFEGYHILWIFVVVILLTVLASAAYNWVVDQKLQLIIDVLLLVILAATGYLTAQGENYIGGPAFTIFVAVWILVEGALFLAPVEAEAPKAKAKEKPKREEPARKNGPTPRPYPVKTEAQKKKEEPKEEPKKKEAPKKEEPKKTEAPKEEPKKEEPKKTEIPKLKVMSSKNAAAARDAAKKEEPIPEPVKEEPAPVPAPVPEPEPVKEEPIPEPVPEPVKEEPISVPEPEPIPESSEEETEEVEDYGDFEIAEDTPDALVRRATWNKGLRCRRDYGEHQIPIAFVKGRVAVYVVSEIGDTSGDDKLREEGWTVFRYLESDITDGKDQGEEIHKAVKENAKVDRAKKKKPAKK